jgi:hypothetical protein
MRSLDDELRSALRRLEPPAGFVERVMARLAARPAPRAGWAEAVRSFFRMPRLRWAAVGIAACLLLVIGVAQYQREQRAQGEMAKVQLKQALHIASSKLNLARKRVQGIDRRSPES